MSELGRVAEQERGQDSEPNTRAQPTAREQGMRNAGAAQKSALTGQQGGEQAGQKSALGADSGEAASQDTAQEDGSGESSIELVGPDSMFLSESHTFTLKGASETAQRVSFYPDGAGVEVEKTDNDLSSREYKVTAVEPGSVTLVAEVREDGTRSRVTHKLEVKPPEISWNTRKGSNSGIVPDSERILVRPFETTQRRDEGDELFVEAEMVLWDNADVPRRLTTEGVDAAFEVSSEWHGEGPTTVARWRLTPTEKAAGKYDVRLGIDLGSVKEVKGLQLEVSLSEREFNDSHRRAQDSLQEAFSHLRRVVNSWAGSFQEAHEEFAGALKREESAQQSSPFIELTGVTLLQLGLLYMTGGTSGLLSGTLKALGSGGFVADATKEVFKTTLKHGVKSAEKGKTLGPGSETSNASTTALGDTIAQQTGAFTLGSLDSRLEETVSHEQNILDEALKMIGRMPSEGQTLSIDPMSAIGNKLTFNGTPIASLPAPEDSWRARIELGMWAKWLEEHGHQEMVGGFNGRDMTVEVKSVPQVNRFGPVQRRVMTVCTMAGVDYTAFWDRHFKSGDQGTRWEPVGPLVTQKGTASGDR